MPDQAMTSRDTDIQAIVALVEAYRVGFATLDAEQLQSIWDRDYETIYCPIELAKPIRGWSAIAQYYQRVTTIFDSVSLMEVADLSIEVLGDVAFAFFTFRFEGEFKGRSEPHRVEGRNTLIVRRKESEWKAIHYHESRTGPY